MSGRMTIGEVQFAFSAFAQSVGLPIAYPIPDGQIHKFDVADGKGRPKRGRGWYVLHADGLPNGVVCDHADGIRHKWTAKAERPDPAARAELARRVEARKRDQEAAEAKKHAAAAEVAAAIVAACKLADAAHPYLARKGVRPDGFLQNADGDLVLPLRDVAGKLWSTQRIIERPAATPDGEPVREKKNQPGGRKQGSFAPFGRALDALDGDGFLVLCEGAATAASIAEAVPEAAVIAATDAGNLEPVALALRAAYPTTPLVLCADNDQGKKQNVGVSKGRAAATAATGFCVIPALADWTEPLDANDLHAAGGLEAVRDLVVLGLDAARTVLAPPAPRPTIDGDGEPMDADPPSEDATLADAERGARKPDLTAKWMDYLLRSNGRIRETALENIRMAVSNMFPTLCWLDLFHNRLVMAERPPWDNGEGEWTPRPVEDADLNQLIARIEYSGLAPSKDKLDTALRLHADITGLKFDPVKDYLTGLQFDWDGVPRLETWLHDLAGADDTPLNRAFGRKWFIAAVARALRPGCKADNMLVLEGPEELQKSSLFSRLATINGHEYFLDKSIDTRKDGLVENQMCWIREIAELDGIKGREVSAIKNFLSQKDDTYREPYARLAKTVPRRFVFCGSVNPGGEGYLQSQTGNRRFWIVRVNRKIDLSAVDACKDQLWAEAVAAFQAGEAWWLEDPALIKAAGEVAETRTETDHLTADVAAWLRRLKTSDEYGGLIATTKSIADECLGITLKDQTSAVGRRVAVIMGRLGWEKSRARSGSLRDEYLWRPTQAWFDRDRADAAPTEPPPEPSPPPEPTPVAKPAPATSVDPQTGEIIELRRFGFRAPERGPAVLYELDADDPGRGVLQRRTDDDDDRLLRELDRLTPADVEPLRPRRALE
jgi:putative DNA primase/helicase